MKRVQMLVVALLGLSILSQGAVNGSQVQIAGIRVGTDKVSPAQVETSNKALLIGVEEYPTHSLPGNREDVRLLSEALVTKGAFTSQQIKVLLDRDASKANILKAMDEWLIHGTRPKDTVFFYFSGHSVNLWYGDEIRSALAPWDGKVTKGPEQRKFEGQLRDAFTFYGASNLLLDDELIGMVKDLKGRNVILVIDGGMGPLEEFRDRVHGKTTKSVRRSSDQGATDTTEDAKLAVLAAASNSESEIHNFQEFPQGNHSVFTWFMLNGLQGKANPKGGPITLGNLAKFVEGELKAKGYHQVPQHIFNPTSFEDFPLIKTP